jgi:NAD(P)-dependent dehydrogenase (short-subunit alcohol dehydrogenase family)
MLKPIEGRSVIVTGASGGIGKGIASVFAAKGAQVLVVARNSGPAEATANEKMRQTLLAMQLMQRKRLRFRLEGGPQNRWQL